MLPALAVYNTPSSGLKMSAMNGAEAGPSKGKRRAEEPTIQPSKAARIASPTGTGDDFESDEPQLGNGVDPMEALEDSVDPMDALEALNNGNGDINEDEGERKTDDGEEEEEEQPVLPRRADEFEQEAEREVEASKGLDGAAAEEGKMKLVHQVRHQVSCHCQFSHPIESSSNYISSSFLGRITTRLSIRPHRST